MVCQKLLENTVGNQYKFCIRVDLAKKQTNKQNNYQLVSHSQRMELGLKLDISQL